MTDKRIKNREKLQSLLRDLFRFDQADLNFGIYRIMREIRHEVERFIDRDLLDIVGEALIRIPEAEKQKKKEQLYDLQARLEGAIDNSGEVIWENLGGLTQARNDAQDYEELRAELKRVQATEEAEAAVFNDLYRFFSRYYDQGDCHRPYCLKPDWPN